MRGRPLDQRTIVNQAWPLPCPVAPQKCGPQHQHGANADGAIGNVEGRVVPVPRCPVDQYEIDNLAEPKPVDHVTQCTADDQRQRRLDPHIMLALQPTPAPRTDDDGQRDKEPALPATGRCQKAERSTGVVGQYPVKERQHIDALARLELRVEVRLGDLVEADHQQDDAEPAAGWELRSLCASRPATFNEMTPECGLSAKMAVVDFQQICRIAQDWMGV